MADAEQTPLNKAIVESKQLKEKPQDTDLLQLYCMFRFPRSGFHCAWHIAAFLFTLLIKLQLYLKLLVTRTSSRPAPSACSNSP